MAENTFLGLQPYTEADAYRFKGRSEESQELFRLIVRNDYTVCYAESGEGKTSLLNAGVFPLLRQNMFFPIEITFTSDDYQRTPDSFDAIIDRCIRDSITEYNETNKGINIEYKLCSTDFQDTDRQYALQQVLSKYSWWKLRNYKPQAMGLTFTPVFVFDQFEEVFNLPGSIVWINSFFEWLAKVSSDSCPDEIVEKVRRIIGENAPFPVIKEEKDFKAVFSLRKEFIGELDYWGMQKSFIPQLKYNRYCLKALTYVGAKKVMTQQQRFAEDKVEQVLHFFVQQYSCEPEKTKSKNLPVIPALLLSVVCDSWEKDVNFFSGKDVNEIGQSLNMILKQFYNETLSSITKELQEGKNQTDSIREDIETAIFALVDINGKRVRRKSSELSHLDFDAKYKEILSKKRIIKISKIDGEDYVEIVHDCLCPIVSKRKELRLAAEAKEREERLLKEQAKKMRKRLSLFALFAIIVIGFVSVFLWQQKKATDAIEKTQVYKAKSDSIQELKAIVESQYENLRIDSILLASHLSHILKDSVLLVSKNDSLKQQIIINQQKDKIIERLEALSQLRIEHNVAGKLSECISSNLKYLATSLSISGQLNGTDIVLLREMIINGSLKHLDMENAKIVRGGEAYFGKFKIKEDNVLGDYLFEKCTRLLSINIPNSVTSIGYNAFEGCSGLTAINIPNSVTSIGYNAFEGCSGLTAINIPNSVTSIGYNAFEGCSGLTAINIPNSVKRIGFGAFYGCSGLTAINIPNSVTSIGDYAFEGCSGLTAINIPNSVTSIGHRVFKGCSGLTAINIPNSVTSIGDYAFEFCSGLTAINIPNSVNSIGSDAFKDCSGLTAINIPNSVTSIGDSAFEGCSGLTATNIPNSVTSIGSGAFVGCSGLTAINIPNSVTSIGHRAFKGCSGLAAINIPNSVTSIGDYAFVDCSGLTAINIPNSVTSIGDYAFYGCSDLTAINIPNSVTSIGDYAFGGCSGLTAINILNSVTSIGSGAFKGCSGLTAINIPNSVTSIGYRVFEGCSGLTAINISNSVKSIEIGAFEGCSGLAAINIPNSVTSIGNRAFEGCSGLTAINIPNSVTSIGSGAFGGCSGLTAINIPNSVTSIGDYAFEGCSGLTAINIPNSVTSIGHRVFEGCSGLTAINIPNSVKRIGFGAFYGCSGLTAINIPNSVTSIRDYAFYGCSGLTAINIPNSVTSIGDYAFEGCSGLTAINIPNSVTSIGHRVFKGCSGIVEIKSHIKAIDNLNAEKDSFGYSDDLNWIVPVGPNQDKDIYVKKYKEQPWWNEKWKIKHE